MPECKMASGFVGMFFTVPELVLRLCQVLDDADLLVLSQVSSGLNTLALQTIFIFHGITLEQFASGVLSLSSLSLFAFRLAIFVPSLKVTRLCCSFDVSTAQSDIRSLQRVLSRLPPIPELSIITYTAAELNMHWSNSLKLDGTFSDLLFALGPYKNILILSRGAFTVSKRRRILHPKSLSGCFPFTIRSGWSFIGLLPLICSFLLAQRLVDASATVLSALSDPCIRTLQDERIYNDVEISCHFPRDIRITSPMLPSNYPSLAKWTMATFDESVMTSLRIKHIAFLDGEKWHSILSSLRLSRLEYLTIQHGAHISLDTLISFLIRHPTVRSLELSHHSIPYSSYPPNPHTKLSIPSGSLHNLETLHASSRFIHMLLQSIPAPLPNLCHIHIGPKLQWPGNGLSQPDVREKVETPFDFPAWESALTTVRVCARPVERLGVTLPGGSVARKWLALSAAAGKLQVETLSIATERGIPLSSSVILPLADWIISTFMTAKLRTIELKPWVIVSWSKRARFDTRIRESPGAGDVQVNFSVGVHSLDW